MSETALNRDKLTAGLPATGLREIQRESRVSLTYLLWCPPADVLRTTLMMRRIEWEHVCTRTRFTPNSD